MEDSEKLVNIRQLGKNHHRIVSMAVISIVVYRIYKLSQVGKRDSRMPPGPPTTAVLGNILDIPTTGLGKSEWIWLPFSRPDEKTCGMLIIGGPRFREWSQQYGKIFSLKIGPRNIIVICDRKAVYELIDRKGSIYSDRPPNIVPLFITR